MTYREFLEEQRVNMIEELMNFVCIDSVYDSKTVSKETPYGKGVSNALNYVAKLGERYGFEVDKCDGHCTELTIGEGNKMIGIFAHADVVPATGDWSDYPFSCKVLDGKVYGRGTSDDKGPFMAAFYAVLALKEAGLLKGYKVRFVVGGDEERGSSCLDYYFNVLKKPSPDYGFTPDADFPVIYGEKGINDFFPGISVEIPHVLKISGGAATNAVCDKVEIELDNASEFVSYLKSKKVSFKEDGNKVTILGKSAHGSTPELGDNAAIKTMKILGDFYNVKSLQKLADGLSDTSGKKFGGFCKTKLMGETTYCVGLISYEKGHLKFSINFRYPEVVKSSEYKDKFDAYFATKSKMGEESHVLFFDPESKLVKTLMQAYQEETGDKKSKPITIGGGTYAKHCENTVAFGALFPGRESVMHQPDEYMPEEDIYKSALIYARAIELLGNLK